MLTRETFMNAIRKIKKHEELMDRLDSVCREFGDFEPSLDFGNLHLQALLDVLQEAMNDESDYIGWWLYEDVEHVVTWEEEGREIVRHLTDINALYDFLVENNENSKKCTAHQDGKETCAAYPFKEETGAERRDSLQAPS